MRKNLSYCFHFLLLFLVVILLGGCTSTQFLETPSPSPEIEITISPLLPSTTPTALPTKTVIVVSPTATASITPTVSPTVVPSETPKPFVAPPFKLAYSVLDGPFQGRWVLDTSLEAPFKVAKRYPGNVNWPWSHDGRRMAVVNNPNNQTVIQLIDLDTGITNTVFLPNIPRFDPNGLYFRGTLHWSRDDRWLAYYESGDVGYDFVVKSWLINTDTKQAVELPLNVYFSSWSFAVPDQYLYIFLDYPSRTGPEEAVDGHISVLIGQVGFDEPVFSFPDMGLENTPQFGWHILLSPDGRLAVSEGHTGAEFSIIRMFFETSTWEVVGKGRASQFDFLPYLWSPDSHWIVLWKASSIYLWEVEQSNEPFALKLPENARPLTWTSDSQYLIYYKDNYLYAVNPVQIDQPIQFYDLSNLNLSDESLYTLDLWLDSN